MKVTIDFNEMELGAIIAESLESGLPVQKYIKPAVRFFHDLLKKEREGFKIGFGNKERFTSYNTEVSPTNYLTGEE